MWLLQRCQQKLGTYSRDLILEYCMDSKSMDILVRKCDANKMVYMC